MNIDTQNTTHIARAGETEYAAIVRNRSGQDAGEIDFGLKTGPVIDDLSDGDKQRLVDVAYALAKACEMATGKQASEGIEIGRLRSHVRRCKDRN